MVDWYNGSLVIPRQLSAVHPRMTVHLEELDLENPDDVERIWHVSELSLFIYCVLQQQHLINCALCIFKKTAVQQDSGMEHEGDRQLSDLC